MVATETRVRIERVTDIREHVSTNGTQVTFPEVYLDVEAGWLGMRKGRRVGEAYPMREWHGYVQAWNLNGIPTTREANAILTEMKPLAQRIVAGYESVWDGNNHVARYSDDAQAAIDELDVICNAYDDSSLTVWDADDWLNQCRDEFRTKLRRNRKNPGYLDRLADRLEREAYREGAIVEGISSYLEDLLTEEAV